MYQQRKVLFAEWERTYNTKVMLYVTGDRPNLETQIHPEVLDHLIKHLDKIDNAPKISLFIYTRGGSTLAGWSISNLIRQFCTSFEIIVPSKAHSAGTLICLGADSIMMTKQATLGPIDPSINGPLNPPIPGAPPNARAPVSVEAINGFIGFARESLGLREGPELRDIFLKLCEQVHPLVLGDVYRSRSQIRMLAKRLVCKQIQDPNKIEQILEFLCSESGSHDYSIYRKEAREGLGLNIQKPDDISYPKIKAIYDDFADELQLGVAYSPDMILAGNAQATYSFTRGLIESTNGGSHKFVSEGELFRRQIQVQPGMMQNAVEDNRRFEGWKHENVE